MTPESLVLVQEKETQLVRDIEAVQALRQSAAWSSLKTDIFDGLVRRLKSELLSEAKKEEPSPLKLNRLAGELKWADKFSDLEKWEKELRLELQRVRTNLSHGTKES